MENDGRGRFFGGQASVEFIMTYAWVLLILVVVLVVVWQLGLFKLGGVITPGSMGFWGVTPSDFKLASGGTLSVSLANYIGANVTIRSVTANQSDSNVVRVLSSTVIEPGDERLITIGGLKQASGGSRFEILLGINYTDSRTGNQHRSSGRIWGSYEAAA